jgi:hypothetical protein
MQIKWNDLVPVVISVIVILIVALVERHSKLVAAVTATMPLTIPLALWIVYSSNRGDPVSIERFTRNMVAGIIPTLAFAIAVWLGARAGVKLTPLILIGYTVWALVLLLILGLQRLLGIA